MIGLQKDVAPLLEACDIVLLTSINEGTPTALIEAMFAGRPFVATDAGGTADLALDLQPDDGNGIRTAQNGFIVERNSEAILTCLERLARDPSLRDTMGRTGQEHANENWGSARLIKE